MNDVTTFVEVFAPLGSGRYITIRGRFAVECGSIEEGTEDLLAVRFRELDENGDPIPGAAHGFTRGYSIDHDYEVPK